jgi:hypothetical protein
MELVLQIVLLVIGVGGAIVTAVTVRKKAWRVGLTIGFSCLGIVGLVLTLATYLHPKRSAPQPVCNNTTSSNCAEINNGQQTIVQGYVLPPRRRMTQAQIDAAIAVLKTAPKGSTAILIYVGKSEDNEINPFFDQVVGLFASSADHWKVTLKRTGPETFTADGGILRGEGIGCSVDRATNGAGDIAKRALSVAGFPCTRDAIGWIWGLEKPSADIYVSIGTRIVPSD